MKKKLRRMERQLVELEARVVAMEDRAAMAGALLAAPQDRRSLAERAA